MEQHVAAEKRQGKSKGMKPLSMKAYTSLNVMT